MKIISNGRCRFCSFSIFEQFPEVHAFISTRHSPALQADLISLSEKERQESIFKSEKSWYDEINIPYESIVRIIQVHSKKLIYSKKPGIFGEFDGIITDRRNLYLRIVTADCLPIFIYDPKIPAIALVHAGWRGLYKNIVSEAVNEMCARFQSKPQELFVAVGPFIQVCCYSVKRDVAKKFPQDCLEGKNNGMYRLDLKKIIRGQLMCLAIPGNNVEIAHECTCCREDVFWSARRDKQKTERNVSIIGLE